jgi:hypothetical protein
MVLTRNNNKKGEMDKLREGINYHGSAMHSSTGKNV